MKTVERILFVLILLGLLFKLEHWPLASFLLIIGTSTLSLSYWLSPLWFGAPGRKDQITSVSMISGLVLSVALMGILFKLQYWPLSGFYLFLALIGCPAVIIMQLGLAKDKLELARYRRALLTRTLAIAVPAILLYFTPSTTLVKIQYHDDPIMAKLMIERVQHPQDTATWHAIDRYRDQQMRARVQGR